jgi:hypothetical protein
MKELLRDYQQERVYHADSIMLKEYIYHFKASVLSDWSLVQDENLPNGAFYILISKDYRLHVQLTPKSILAKMGMGLMAYQGAGPFGRYLTYLYQLEVGGYPPDSGVRLFVKLVEHIDRINEYPPIHNGDWIAPSQLEQLSSTVSELHAYLSGSLG